MFSNFFQLSSTHTPKTQQKKMEKLLQWAVNNSDNTSLAEQAAAIRRGEAQPDPKRYDPKVLEAILGKDDATRMKGKGCFFVVDLTDLLTSP